MARQKKAVARKPTKQELATVAGFENDADQGFEDTTADDFAIPFLSILQKLSPVCDEDDPKFTKGARPGQVMNTVTEQRFSARLEEQESILVIPCAYLRQFIEWKKREDGGGFVGIHDVQAGEELRAECVRDDQ